jgi:hypothetical protein
MGTTRRADGSANARLTAATLLEAYYFQDERERHLLSANVGGATAARQKALDCMATTYEMEFPHLDRFRVREAGEAFMHALFVQDEIENWAKLRERPEGPEDDLRDALVSDPEVCYGRNPIEDVRWEHVETSLRETCRKAGIDDRYASRQTRFWVLHGQCDPEWERVAHDAHELKLRALVDDPPERAVDRLGQQFVDGVRIHDEWTHSDAAADIEAAIDLVTEYYDELFDLRSGGDIS